MRKREKLQLPRDIAVATLSGFALCLVIIPSLRRGFGYPQRTKKRKESSRRAILRVLRTDIGRWATMRVFQGLFSCRTIANWPSRNSFQCRIENNNKQKNGGRRETHWLVSPEQRENIWTLLSLWLGSSSWFTSISSSEELRNEIADFLLKCTSLALISAKRQLSCISSIMTSSSTCLFWSSHFKKEHAETANHF